VTGLDDYTFELRDQPPPEPWTLEQIDAFLADYEAYREAHKRILACAPDVYERIRSAIESGPLAAYYRVTEHPYLQDGQVLSIDPAVFELPPPEQVIDADAFKPQYRCGHCFKPTYAPGHCAWCEVFADAFRARPVSLLPIITGLGT
jgi:hypothetical protein